MLRPPSLQASPSTPTGSCLPTPGCATWRDASTAVRDLPIISPHGHVPVEWLARQHPVHRPHAPAPLPGPLHLPAAARAGRSARLLGVGDQTLTDGGEPGGLADLLRALAPVPGHAQPVLDGERPQRTSSASPSGRARSPPTRSTTGSRSASRRPEFRPRSCSRRFGIDVLATTDDPVRRPRAPRGAAPPTRASTPASSRPSAPTATSSRAAPASPTS